MRTFAASKKRLKFYGLQTHKSIIFIQKSWQINYY